MLQTFSIALVDPDARRRAEISFAGSQVGMHIEPFENASELSVISDKRAVLVHDQGRMLEDSLQSCERDGVWLPMIAYAFEPAAIRVAEMIIAGAVDYLPWPFTAAELRASLERARNRGNAIGKPRAEARKARTTFEILSGREQEVISGMAEGLSNKEIAERLGISRRTVEAHRANALVKMGVASSNQAIRVAFLASQGDGPWSIETVFA